MATGLQLRIGSSRVLGQSALGQPCRSKPFYQPSPLLLPRRTFLHRSGFAHRTESQQRTDSRRLGIRSNLRRDEERCGVSQRIGSASESSFSGRKAVGLGKSTLQGRHQRGQALKALEGDLPSASGQESRSNAAEGGALEKVIRFVVVKVVFIIHRLLLGVKTVTLALWRFQPVRVLRNATVSPIAYSEGDPSFRTPGILKPFAWLLRLVLFFVPPFIKRRVGPVIHGVTGRMADRSLAFVRKTERQGLSGVGEWAEETAQIARKDAPVVLDFLVRLTYRGLQLGALTMLISLLRRAYYLTPDQYEWIPKGAGKAYRFLWAVIDYLFLDMDWVQPLQRFIVEIVWPFWQDYWLLSAICIWIWQRLYPGVVTYVDIYGEEAED